MRIDDELRYSAPPDAVAVMLTDPAFNEAVSQRMGAVAQTTEVTGDPTGPFTVTTVRTLPTDEFPDVARRFVGATVDVREVDTWQAPAPDGSRDGTITVEVQGAPLKLTGTLRMRPDADGSVESVSGDLKASVPLIGGSLEKAAAPAIRAAIRQRGKVGGSWAG